MTDQTRASISTPLTELNKLKTDNSNKNRTGGRFRRLLIGVITILLIAGIVAFGAWSFYNYQEVEEELDRLTTVEGQQELAQKQIDDLLEKVGELLVLPQDEQPTIATVADVEALRVAQPFFEDAENGDRVIVYTQAGRAILYSPTKDIVVNVGSVVIDEQGTADNN